MRTREGWFESGNQLVIVFETNDQIQVAMAKGLLEDAGIPFFVEGEIATVCQTVDPLLRKWIRIQVPEERAADARDLLNRLFTGVPYVAD